MKHILTDDAVKIEDGTLLEATLPEGCTDIEIPSVLQGQQVIRIGDRAFLNNELKSVILPEGVEKGHQSFDQCVTINKLNANREDLLSFFLWFRENGDKYVDKTIEEMIDVYMREVEE